MSDLAPHPKPLEDKLSKDGVWAKWPVTRALVVNTRRFKLQTMMEKDVTERLYGWFDMPEFNFAFPAFNKPKTLDDFRKRFAVPRHGVMRTVLIKHEETPIGLLWVVGDAPGRNMQTHNFIGEKEWWGWGVMHEARAGLMKALFQLGAHRIYGMPRADNVHAVRCYREQGFIEEGRMRKHYPHPDGHYEDAHVFGMLAEEFIHERSARPPERIRAKIAAWEAEHGAPKSPSKARGETKAAETGEAKAGKTAE